MASLVCPIGLREALAFVDVWRERVEEEGGRPVSSMIECLITFHPSHLSSTGALCPSPGALPGTEVKLGLQPAQTGNACWSLDESPEASLSLPVSSWPGAFQAKTGPSG